MTSQKKTRLNAPFGVPIGLAATVALTMVWHFLGGASPPTPTYEYTDYFMGCVGLPFIAAYFAISIALRPIVRRRWSIALGMMLPLPVAFGIELSLNRTTHNLFPFEVIGLWLPAFGLAQLGGYFWEIMAAHWTIELGERVNRNDDPAQIVPAERRVDDSNALASQKKNNPVALTGFILGIASVIFSAVVGLSLLGIIVSSIGLRFFDREDENNRWMACWGLGLSIVVLVLHIISMFVSVFR